jgi:hypothetical protein
MRFTDNTTELISNVTGRTDARELSEIRPTRDDIFEMLSNERRRCVLYYLQRQPGPVGMRSVVEYVTAWQNDKPIEAVTPRERTRVYSALHQTHLPKLASVGLIEYDTDRSEISIRDDAEYARLYLEYDPGNDIDWSSLYLGITGLGAAFAVAYTVGLPPFGTVGPGVLVWGLLVLFAVSATAHAVHNRRNRLALEELFEVEQ